MSNIKKFLKPEVLSLIKSQFQLILQMKIKIREEKKRKKMRNNVKNKTDRFG